MINKNIVIVVLARNCASSIIRNIPNIERLRSFFIQSDVVVVENDSTDNTKEVILAYGRKYERVHIISKNFNGRYPFDFTGACKIPSISRQRIARMAFIRNIALQYIEENFSPNYVMFIDIDILSFSVDGIINSLNCAPTNWGGLFANGREYYNYHGQVKSSPFQYDSFAYLSKKSRIEEIPLYLTNNLVQKVRSYYLDKIVEKQDFVPVLSAFGGIGIYNYEAIKDAHYSIFEPKSWKGKNISICEHVSVNKIVVDRSFSNYISKNMTVVYAIKQKNGLKGFLLNHFTALYNFLDVLIQKSIKS